MAVQILGAGTGQIIGKIKTALWCNHQPGWYENAF